MLRTHRDRSAGQALVEFSLAITVFLVLLLALFDFGRAIFMYNGVSQAAREIARTASVHPGVITLGLSPEIDETVAIQKGLVPALQDPTFQCVADDGSTKALDVCMSELDYVKVTVTAPYAPVTPLLAFMGTFDLSSSSTQRLS